MEAGEEENEEKEMDENYKEKEMRWGENEKEVDEEYLKKRKRTEKEMRIKWRRKNEAK